MSYSAGTVRVSRTRRPSDSKPRERRLEPCRSKKREARHLVGRRQVLLQSAATATGRRRYCRSRSRCRPAENHRRDWHRRRGGRGSCCVFRRFSRRAVTRPGFGGAARSTGRSRARARRRRPDAAPPALRLFFGRHGAVLQLPHDLFQRSRLPVSDATDCNASRLRPFVCVSLPWQG